MLLTNSLLGFSQGNGSTRVPQKVSLSNDTVSNVLVEPGNIFYKPAFSMDDMTRGFPFLAIPRGQP